MRKTPRRRKQSEDPKQLISAIVISMLCLIMWQSMFPPPAPVAPKPEPEAPSASKNQGLDFSNLTSSELAKQGISGQKGSPQSLSKVLPPSVDVRVLNAEGIQKVTLNSRGQVSQWAITEHQYRKKILDPGGVDERSTPYILATQDHSQGAPFLTPTLEVYVQDQKVEGVYEELKGNDQDSLLSLKAGGVHIERRYIMAGDRYSVTAQVKVINLTGQRNHVKIIGVNRGLQDASESGGSMFSPPLNLLESLCVHGDEIERDTQADLQSKVEDKEPMRFSGSSWIGVDSRYFMSAMSAEHPVDCIQRVDKEAHRLERPPPPHLSPIVTEAIIFEGYLDHQAEAFEEVNLYVGPKKLEVLQKNTPSLSEAIDFGLFTTICLPMLYMLKTFFDLIPNWGLAIIFLTLLVKLITFPLTVKQYKSMAGMKKLQPELKALKEEFQKTDPMRFQQESMALYKKHGVSPLAGCFPMLLMMPIYFALYRTIFSAVELYQAEFFGWLNDLSLPDPYFVTPVILAGLMLIQARLQPNPNMDPTQRKMLTVFMPVFFGLMMLFLPSGLVLYILVNTVLGIFQQRWSQKQMEMA
jgi:YidC/Oxa1 family membrane protein insertase